MIAVTKDGNIQFGDLNRIWVNGPEGAIGMKCQPSFNNGFLWGVGLAGTLPTATENDLKGDQWRFGPELFGIIRKWGIARFKVQSSGFKG